MKSPIRLKKYYIESTPELAGMRIIFLSDFHNAKNGALNDSIVDTVKSARPNLILLGGDMVNGRQPEESYPTALDLVNRMSDISPVYYAYGNHEKKITENIYGNSDTWDGFRDAVEKKAVFLVNEKTTPVKGLNVYGLDIPPEYYSRGRYPKLKGATIAELIGKRDRRGFNILLGHTPDFFSGYSAWGADLVLSGHYHGGIIRLPLLGGVISPRLHLFPKYDYGLYENKKSKMIVTNGIGQHSIKIRFNNKPEVVLIIFKEGKENVVK